MTDVATIEADQQTGSTPEQPEIQPAQSPEVVATPAKSEPAESAQGDSAKVDKDAAAIAWLEAGKDPKAFRQSLEDAAEPSTEAKQDGAPQTPAKRDRLPDGTFAPAKPEPVADAKADAANFGDLNANQLQALRRTQLLPTPAIWKETPLLVRANLVQQAQRIAQAQGRISQQMGQARQNQNSSPDGQASAPAAQNPTGAQSNDDPSQGQFQRQPGGTPASRAQQQGQAPPVAQPAPEVDPLKGFSDYFGDEVAAPIRQAFGNQQQVIQQLQQQLQNRDTAHAAETQWLAQQTFLPQEQQALKTLQADVPNAGKSTEDLQRLRAVAGTYFDAAQQAGTPMTWHDATLWAGRAMYQPDAKQAAQQSLLQRSVKSLAGSPSKPTLRGPTRTMSKDDWDTQAFGLLQAGGRTAKEVQAMRRE